MKPLTPTQRKVLEYCKTEEHSPDAIVKLLWGGDPGGRRYLTASKIVLTLGRLGYIGVAQVFAGGRWLPNGEPRPFEYVMRGARYLATTKGREALRE